MQVVDYQDLDEQPGLVLKRLCKYLHLDSSFTFDTQLVLNSRLNRGVHAPESKPKVIWWFKGSRIKFTVAGISTTVVSVVVQITTFAFFAFTTTISVSFMFIPSCFFLSAFLQLFSLRYFPMPPTFLPTLKRWAAQSVPFPRTHSYNKQPHTVPVLTLRRRRRLHRQQLQTFCGVHSWPLTLLILCASFTSFPTPICRYYISEMISTARSLRCALPFECAPQVFSCERRDSQLFIQADTYHPLFNSTTRFKKAYNFFSRFFTLPGLLEGNRTTSHEMASAMGENRCAD